MQAVAAVEHITKALLQAVEQAVVEQAVEL
jgi:hypothetical protein